MGEGVAGDEAEDAANDGGRDIARGGEGKPQVGRIL